MLDILLQKGDSVLHYLLGSLVNSRLLCSTEEKGRTKEQDGLSVQPVVREQDYSVTSQYTWNDVSSRIKQNRVNLMYDITAGIKELSVVHRCGGRQLGHQKEIG